MVAAILAFLTALLPVLMRWLEKQTPDTLDTRNRHERELKDLAATLAAGDALGVAAVFAERDRLLRLKGIRPS